MNTTPNSIRLSLSQMECGDPEEVCRRVKGLFHAVFPAEDASYIEQRFHVVQQMFSGDYPGYLPMDTAYHNLEHTLQTTCCFAVLIKNRHQAGVLPVLRPKDFSLGLIAILLHDTGYLKTVDDPQGSGAKYTHIHEQRSCKHARAYLQKRLWDESSIQAVENLIRCTGPRSDIRKVPFRSEHERVLGNAVCTADYIGQISDPGYVDKLPSLYGEFVESYRYQGIPFEQWMFKSYSELLRKTPAFWEHFVIPKMQNECQSIWNYFRDPETGENPYLDSVFNNLSRIEEEIRRLPPNE